MPLIQRNKLGARSMSTAEGMDDSLSETTRLSRSFFVTRSILFSFCFVMKGTFRQRDKLVSRKQEQVPPSIEFHDGGGEVGSDVEGFQLQRVQLVRTIFS